MGLRFGTTRPSTVILRPSGRPINVGYCIYGGGACNGGVALDPGAEFLASKKHAYRSAEDVYFTTSDGVDASVALKMSALNNILGWYDTNDPSTINWINAGGATGEFYFTPTSSFGLVANTTAGQTNKKGVLLGSTFYSQDTYGTHDIDSHFAFFSTPAPEPGMMGLVGAGLIGTGMIFRRKKQTKQ